MSARKESSGGKEAKGVTIVTEGGPSYTISVPSISEDVVQKIQSGFDGKTTVLVDYGKGRIPYHAAT